MKNWLRITVIGLAIAACDEPEDDQSLNETDRIFVEQAALANIIEMDFANIASARASSEAVRNFATLMITEHTTAQAELQEIVRSYNNVHWPQSLDDTHQEIKRQLQNSSGYRFDSLYMATQVTDHQTTITLFQQQQISGFDKVLKSYANKHLPELQEHLQMAQSIHGFLLTQEPE